VDRLRDQRLSVLVDGDRTRAIVVKFGAENQLKSAIRKSTRLGVLSNEFLPSGIPKSNLLWDSIPLSRLSCPPEACLVYIDGLTDTLNIYQAEEEQLLSEMQIQVLQARLAEPSVHRGHPASHFSSGFRSTFQCGETWNLPEGVGLRSCEDRSASSKYCNIGSQTL
jgi:hypothetical protein